MRKKFFKPLAIGWATALIAVTSFVSYAMGLVRDRIIAVNFGTTNATDTYNASFLIPDLLFNLFIAGALMAAFLPIFSEYLVKNKEEANKIASTMLTCATLVISGLAVLAFIFMESIIPFIFPNIDANSKLDIINMTRMMLPSAILFAVSNTLGNILMSYKHFIAYALSPILYNLGIIFGVIFFRENLGIYSAATGVLIGAGLHCLIRVIDTFATDYKYRPSLNVTHPAFKKILKLMMPKAISLISWQINLYIFAVIGMKMIEGGLAAFNFARNIQSFAVSLFGISFATAVFPYMATAFSEKDQKSYVNHVQKTVQRVLFFTIPSMIGLMILTKPLIELILSGGIFQENSIGITSTILFFFAISIPFESLWHIFARAYYARQNTLTPTIINVITMALIALCTIFIAPRFGIEWFSIGFSLSFIIYNIIILTFLRKHLTGFDFKSFFGSLSKTILATGLMAIAILLTSSLSAVISPKIVTILQIIVGTLVFFLTTFLVKSPEVSNISYILKRTFKKNLTNENPV